MDEVGIGGLDTEGHPWNLPRSYELANEFQWDPEDRRRIFFYIPPISKRSDLIPKRSSNSLPVLHARSKSGSSLGMVGSYKVRLQTQQP